MAMTIAELLAEPQLGLGLIAGARGLDRQITWSHTSDLAKLWEWVSEGVLLLTNGLSIPADAEGQVELAHRLSEAGAVGLAVGEKMHAPQFTHEFLEACDALPLPLLNVPFPLPFIAISRSIAEALLIEESRRIKQTARIYDLLRKSSAPGDSWRQLLNDLTRELNARLLVLDERCLHSWRVEDPPANPELERVIRRVRGTAEESNRHFQWSEEDGRSLLLMDIPTQPHALLVVLPQDRARPDGVVLLHTATILGLALSNETLNLEGPRRTAEEYLSLRLRGAQGQTDNSGRLADFGLPSEGLRVVAARARPAVSAAATHQRLHRHGVPNITAIVEEHTYMLLGAGSPVEMLDHALADYPALGLSSVIGLDDLARGIRESLWSLGKARQQQRRIHQYSQDENWLGVAGHEEGTAMVSRLLGPLLEYDHRNEADLMGILRSYLRNQRSTQKVASEIFTHRQTVIYRLRKISLLTGLDLSETSSIAQLWLALQMFDAMGSTIESEGNVR